MFEASNELCYKLSTNYGMKHVTNYGMKRVRTIKYELSTNYGMKQVRTISYLLYTLKELIIIF